MSDTTNIVGIDGKIWNNIKIENIEIEWYDNFGFTLKGTRANMKSYHVRIKGTWDENTNFFEIHHIEYKKLKKIIEEYSETKKSKGKDMNEKNEIRDGWYKIKNQKDVDEVWKLCYGLEKELPKHRIIEIVDGIWNGWFVKPEAILHEYFNYGDVVYVRDRDTREWEKAKYLNYSNMNSSQMATVDNCSGAWKQCISEAEWKEKYKEKPMVINVIGDCATVALIPIHDNEEVTIMRCGDSITYETEKINN